jgi:hypothetical protein
MYSYTSVPRVVYFLTALSLLLACANHNRYASFYVSENPEDYECLERNTYSASERRSKYPFNESAKIELISFHQDTVIGCIFCDMLPVKSGVVDYSRVVERTILHQSAIDSLTHIFYNIGYKGTINTVDSGCCFLPRNAILFFDDTDRLIAFVNICFECYTTRFSSDEVSMGDECTGKYKILQRFFKSHDIEVGITKETKHPLKD